MKPLHGCGCDFKRFYLCATLLLLPLKPNRSFVLWAVVCNIHQNILRNFPSTGVKVWEVRGSALLHSCSVFRQWYFNCVAPFSDCKNHHKMHPTGGTFLRLWERAGVPRDGSLREASVHSLITNHYCHPMVGLRTTSNHLMSRTQMSGAFTFYFTGSMWQFYMTWKNQRT